MEYKSVSLEIVNYSEPTDKHVPLTGVWSVDDEIDGWSWDRRAMQSNGVLTTRYNTYVGGHKVGLLDGTKLSHWQSGVLTGIDFEDFAKYPAFDSLTWTPRYTTGAFSIYWDDRPLYSDWSFSANADLLPGQSQNKITLRDDALYESITAAIYKRVERNEILAVKKFAMVDSFTGVLDGQARVSPGSLPNVDWSKVESRKNEMSIHDGQLYFNGNHTISVGVDEADRDSVEGAWENKGKGLNQGRSLFLDYFPVNAGSVRLVSVSSSGVVTEWTEKDSLAFSQASDRHFSVDYDLGVIETGGYKAPDLVLASTLEAGDTEIEIIPTRDIDSYPSQGILNIDGELILYASRSHTTFFDCIRAYNGTEARDHLGFSRVADVTHGLGTTDSWFAGYEAVPRVDYEVTSYALRSAAYTGWISVKSLSHVKSNKVLQIVSRNENLASIELTSDRPAIGGNLYGPVYYGSDTAKLTATGYASDGTPVEAVPLTIYIKSGAGQLNGSLSSYTANSNTQGQVSCAYNVPLGQDDVDQEVIKTEHVDGDTHMTLALGPNVTPEDCWVFQILKHDPILGTVGNKATAFAGGAIGAPYGLGYIDVWVRHTEDYSGGILRLQDASGVMRTFNINSALASVDGSLEPFTRFYTAEAVTASWVTSSSPVWLLQPDSTEWIEAKARGSRVILYEWSTDAQHPITGDVGAYTPVRPDEIRGNKLIFNDRRLAIPDKYDDDNNLGAYVVVAPAQVRFGAFGRDPFSGRLIRSNDLRFKLILPNSLTGVDDTGALPIPYGWTFVTEEFNIGAGIGGANFITVNPAATGVHQFSITGVIS